MIRTVKSTKIVSPYESIIEKRKGIIPLDAFEYDPLIQNLKKDFPYIYIIYSIYVMGFDHDSKDDGSPDLIGGDSIKIKYDLQDEETKEQSPMAGIMDMVGKDPSILGKIMAMPGVSDILKNLNVSSSQD